jgi:site-specific DNA-methyltransferase (adenine-specific)
LTIYFQDDYITLYHADCLEEQAWLQADVLVTDPPYGVKWKGITTGVNKGYDTHAAGIKNDNDATVRDEVLNLWGNKPAIVFGSWRIPRPENTQHRLIWHKQGQAPGPLNAPFMSQDEEIYILGKGFVSTSPPMRSVIATTEHRGIAVNKAGHPTPKPISLMQKLIERCPDGILADPFAGSGATLEAARNLGRKVIGVELEEKYCELIANRLSQQVFNFTLPAADERN